MALRLLDRLIAAVLQLVGLLAEARSKALLVLANFVNAKAD